MSKSLKKLKDRWFKAYKYNSEGIYIKDINLNVKDVKTFISAKSEYIKSINNERLYLKKYMHNNNIKYALSDDFLYNANNDIIKIGLSGRGKYLNDDELIKYISDSLTHEHIHRALCKIMNWDISFLFDTIGYKFRNVKLQEKALKDTNYMRHERAIQIIGLSPWLKSMGVTLKHKKRLYELTSIL